METPNIEIIETEKPYTLRKLNAGDIVPMCAVIKNIDLKEIKNCFGVDKVKSIIEAIKDDKGESGVNIEAVGFEVVVDVVDIILNNLDRCMDSLFRFLSNLSGMTREEVAVLDLAVFTEMIIDVVKKEEFKDFIKVVSKFLK